MGIKTCLYSGNDDVTAFQYVYDLLDYLKTVDVLEQIGRAHV